MQADKLKVGIVTANYNNGKYFAEYLNGILGQTRKPNYIAIVDDASTDNSVDIITECLGSVLKPQMVDGVITSYAKDGMTAFLFKEKENRGPAGARNIALRCLVDKTDVVCVADSDDVLYPDKLKKSIEVILKFPHIGLVYTDYDTLNEKTGLTAREFKEPFSYKRLAQECIVSNNSMYATSIVKHLGLYDESLRGPEDYDLWLRIAEVASVYHIPEALYKYRLSGNNITITTPSEKFAEQVRKVHLKAEARRNASAK